MARTNQLSTIEREPDYRLRAEIGVVTAPHSQEPFIGMDHAWLLENPQIERLDSVPILPPEIEVEET